MTFLTLPCTLCTNCETLKLTLSDEKTKFTHVDDGFRFLGLDIRRHMSGVGIKSAKLLISQAAREASFMSQARLGCTLVITGRN